jgi:alpha-N-acetylglucosaminidase
MVGLLNGFYKKRWEQFFKYIQSEMGKNKEPDMDHIEQQLKNWEWQWVNGQEFYTTKTKGDAVAKAKEMHQKYFNLIMSETK